MGGWYIYIKTLNKNYALNFRTNWDNEKNINQSSKK